MSGNSPMKLYVASETVSGLISRWKTKINRCSFYLNLAASNQKKNKKIT